MSAPCWSLPKGSLERATLELFEAADLAVRRSSDVDYRATIDDPRVSEVRILRPQEIPEYVAEGLFDLGITGRDWIEETASEVDVARRAPLQQGHVAAHPGGPGRGRRLAGAIASADLPPGIRVSTEYPALTRRFLDGHGVKAEVRLSYGATEAKIPEIADAVVEITETGRALRAAGLRIIDTILVSYTELIANPASYADDTKRHAMQQLLTLLSGTLIAREPGAGQAQRGRGRPATGHRAAAGDEVARPCPSCSARTASRSRRSCPSTPSTR